MRLKSVETRAVYAMCRVHGVITLTTSYAATRLTTVTRQTPLNTNVPRVTPFGQTPLAAKLPLSHPRQPPLLRQVGIHAICLLSDLDFI